jgi:uncharacterized membrane protein
MERRTGSGSCPVIDQDVRSPVTEPVRSARHRLDGDGWTGLALVAALVAMTLVAGLIFTFSAAVMPALADADDRTFVEIMHRFNDNPVFGLTFMGALVLTAVAVVVLWQRRGGSDAAVRWTVAALVLYAIVVAVTFAIHIPLNNDIDDAAAPNRITDLANLAEVRDDVEGPWVAWNILRTVLSIASVAALGGALLLHGRSTADRKAEAGASSTAWPPPPREGVAS